MVTTHVSIAVSLDGYIARQNGTIMRDTYIISWHQTSRDKLRAQKSPQGFQDFVSGSGDHQPRILGWRSLNWLCNSLFNDR